MIHVTELKATCGPTWQDFWRCWDVGRMQVHRSAPPSGKPGYRKCPPLPSQPGARSVGARSLCWSRSPETQMGTKWEKSSFFFLITNLILSLSPLNQHSSNLFFNQDVDPLEHPFTGKLIGNVGLNLKCIRKKCSYRHIIALWGNN